LSSGGWSLNSDIRGFVSILIEIIIGHPVILSRVEQDNRIFGILKKIDFGIVSGVDSADVLAFVDWVESNE
jgi:hypothetical protein